jgi:hypothetical protein
VGLSSAAVSSWSVPNDSKLCRVGGIMGTTYCLLLHRAFCTQGSPHPIKSVLMIKMCHRFFKDCDFYPVRLERVSNKSTWPTIGSYHLQCPASAQHEPVIFDKAMIRFRVGLFLAQSDGLMFLTAA